LASLIDAPKKVEESKPEPVIEEQPLKKPELVSPGMRRPGGFKKGGGKVAPAKKASEPVKKGKQARVWELGGTKADVAALDYSSPPPAKQGNDTDRESENLYSQNVRKSLYMLNYIFYL
jgi:hypothetical protein